MQLGLQQLLVRQAGLVFGDQGWRQAAVKRVLNHLIVFAGAEQYTDGRVLVGFSFIAIQRFQIEVQLAQILRLETADLQLNGHQAVESTVKEQQIQSKITPTDLQRVFGADKAEVAAQLDEEIFQPRQQSLMQIDLGMAAGEAEKLNHIGIAKYLQSIGVRLSQHCRSFCRLSHVTLEQRRLELALQLTFRPLLLDSHTQIELSFFRVFALTEDNQVMRPG